MKCPAGYEEPRAPCSPEKAAAQFVSPSLKASPLKGCVRFMAKPQSPPPRLASTTKPLLNDNTTRGVHNKENTQEQEKTLEEEEALGCEELEDSGFQSLQNSRVEKDEEEEDQDAEEERLSLAQSPPGRYEREEGCTASSSTPSSSSHRNRGDSILPILRFQRAVCHELAENFKRTRSYDWTVVGRLAEHHDLDRVIGRRMGRECVDALAALLERDMRHVLTRILRLLGDMDLITCRRVSRTWRTIISQDSSALHRCHQAEQRLRTQESRTSQEKENVFGLTRGAALSRVVLSCMQTVSSSAALRSQRPCSHKDPQAQPSRFREFQEAACSLQQHESLKRCERCGSPARHHAQALRATCTRQSCGFDCCTRCQSPFHGSAPCRPAPPRGPAPPRDTPLFIGSSRSKRNVRRL